MPKNRNGKMDRARRQAESITRVSAWQKLPVSEKLASLDARLGIDKGAKRQRKRIHDSFNKLGLPIGP